MKKIIPFLLLMIVTIPVMMHAAPVPAPAATANNGSVPVMSTLTNPLNVNSIQDLYTAIFKLIVQIGYVVVAIFLLLSGFKFVTAQGNESKLEEAKHTFYYTIIGALIVIGANTIYAILKGVITALNTP